MRNTESMLITLESKRSITPKRGEQYLTYYNRMEAIGRTTEWHEGHQKYEISRKNQANERAISHELTQANQELKILRHQRLKDLYQTEMEQ